MRTKEDYLNKKISDFPEFFVDENRFIEELQSLELNTCDICGIIEDTNELLWVDQEYYWESLTAQKLVQEGKSAVCKDCFEKME